MKKSFIKIKAAIQTNVKSQFENFICLTHFIEDTLHIYKFNPKKIKWIFDTLTTNFCERSIVVNFKEIP